MSGKKLEELKRRISAHFYNEAEIMKDIMDSDSTKEESKEIEQFIKSHPFSELSRYIQELRQKCLASR